MDQTTALFIFFGLWTLALYMLLFWRLQPKVFIKRILFYMKIYCIIAYKLFCWILMFGQKEYHIYWYDGGEYQEIIIPHIRKFMR